MSLKCALQLSFAVGWFLVVTNAHAAKTFVYCSEGSPANFSPVLVADAVSGNNTFQIYNSLLDWEIGTTKLIPALAESWTVSKDGLTYTFKLRKDIDFHTTAFFTPTRKFNADDVIFSFDRMRLPTHPFHKVSGGKYEFWESFGMSNIVKNVEKVDSHTVRLTLHKADASFIADMAMPFLAIYSAEYGEQLQKKKMLDHIDFEPVGTGPFVWVSYAKDQTVRYKANPTYFGGKAKVDALVFSITPDANVRYQKLKRGECHMVSEVGVADLESIKKDPTIQLLTAPGMNVGFLAMNTAKPPLDKLKVRQAISMALDKASYIKATYLGHATVAKNPLPPTVWGYNDKIKDYALDVPKAKALLAEAGLPNGFEIELWTQPVARPYNPNGKKMGEMMQSDLAKVGIKAKLVTFDWPTYLAKVQKGEHALLQLGWSADNGDPDNFMYGLLSCSAVKGGSNHAQWCYEPYDKLVTQAKRLTTQADRAKLYEEAQVVFHDQAPWAPIANSVRYKALSKNAGGYKMDAFGYDRLATIELK
jgi:dipeptide transport system substrate-binding protein